MRSKTKKLISSILAISLLCTTFFTACGGTSNPETGKPVDPAAPTTEGTTADESTEKLAEVQELVNVFNSDPTTMDPAFSNTVPDQRAQAPIYEGLTKRMVNEEGILVDVPAVAESWDVSADETVYTFHIRKDAKWSDGTPLNANDFDYSWRRVFDPELASPQAFLLQSIIKNGDACMKKEVAMDQLGVKVIDDYTFEVTLEKPNPTFLTLSGYNFVRPVKKEQIEKLGTKYGSSVDTTLGNGPFVLANWAPGSEVSYTANPEYWDKENVKLTKLTTKIIQEASTVAQTLMANEADIAGLNNPDWNDMVDQTGYYDVVSSAKMEMEFMGFNCNDPILKNPKIRLALSLGYDREKYNDEICDGRYVPNYCMTPDISVIADTLYKELVGGKQNVIKDLATTYPDPKVLLLEGMKEEGLGDDPSKLEIHYNTRGVTEFSKKSAEWLKQAWQQSLGVNVLIDMTEWNILYDLVDAGTYQIAALGWNADVGLEPNEFLDLFETPDGYYGDARLHWDGAKADEYTKLLNQCREEKDQTKKAELYLAMEKILAEESPVSPMYATTSRTVVGKYVRNYYSHPLLINDYANVYLVEKA